jgi:hypothetical protein
MTKHPRSEKKKSSAVMVLPELELELIISRSGAGRAIYAFFG